ncbi:hypothetical protein [uncultured Abyssibacter sp.]|uniref:HAD family hydrolase n=1 Tax=uncultured Abyssibacter sp. TaxID=2320202 RepID=UPI0032B20783
MHLVADLENLLLNPLPAIEYCLRTTLREMGYEPEPDRALDWVVNVPFTDAAITLLQDDAPGRIDEFTSRYQRLFACRGRRAYGLYPGARIAVASLQATEQNHLHYLTHIGPAGAQALLEHYSFRHAVDSIFTAPAPQCRMCRPSLLETLSGKLRDQSDDGIAFASDDPAELAMARRMGIHTIGLLYGRTPAAIVRRAAPDLCIEAASALPTAIATLSAAPGVAGAH